MTQSEDAKRAAELWDDMNQFTKQKFSANPDSWITSRSKYEFPPPRYGGQITTEIGQVALWQQDAFERGAWYALRMTNWTEPPSPNPSQAQRGEEDSRKDGKE